MFEKFSDYMYSLLFTPLKKIKQAANQFYIFFRVIGQLFDDTKEDIFRVREESMVASASEIMLAEHGKDRDMARLKGETVEGYRTRLSMKALIAEKAGTEQGILLALAALGYEHSYIERMALHDPERWAEFIIFLGGKYPSGVNDIAVIDGEVMKVKEASSKPFYGIEGRIGLLYLPDLRAVEMRAVSIQKQPCGLSAGEPGCPFHPLRRPGIPLCAMRHAAGAGTALYQGGCHRRQDACKPLRASQGLS